MQFAPTCCRRICTALAIGLSLGLSTGCTTFSHSHKPPIVIRADEVPKKVDDFPELKSFPVIDIHTHTFNARYLPIRNIALARRYDTLPFGLGYLLPDDLVVYVGKLIVEHAQLSKTNSPPQESEALAAMDTAPVQSATVAKRDKLAADLAATPRVQVLEDNGRKIKIKRPKTVDQKQIDRVARRLLGDKHTAGVGTLQKMDDAIPQSSVWRFVHFLTENERSSRRQMTREEFPDVDLFVHHMMDLGPVYGQSPDRTQFIDFNKDQVPRVRAFDRQSNGKFIHFTAFSPYRAKTSHGIDFEEAWKPLEDALRQGAWGVKIYPPSGYRPIANSIPREPWFVCTLRQQWKARYEGYSSKKLDAVMLQFFQRCVEKDIPVFAHCSYAEFQAAKGYGARNANPQYWLKLLRKHPELRNLRLCLGHAGGPDYWFATGSYQQWGKDVVRLCTEYPNIYCEFGASDGIVGGEDPPNRIIFANRILQCTNASPAFAKKIMYGSDWFMPMDINPREKYLTTYRRVFLSPELRDMYKDFFCRNALQFLNMSDQRIDADPLLTAAGKAALHKLRQRASQ
jgi:predicted TIM-barrel fold metal-dependent hydrolase